MVPGSAMAFSSYPGSVVSGDDFYVVSSGLVGEDVNVFCILLVFLIW